MYFERTIQGKRVEGNVYPFQIEHLHHSFKNQTNEITIKLHIQSVADTQIMCRMIDIIKEAEIVYC